MRTLADDANEAIQEEKDAREKAKAMLLGGDDTVDDKYLAFLETQVASDRYKSQQRDLTKKVEDLYVEGQDPAVRRNCHVSDILSHKKCRKKLILLHCYEQNAVIHGYQLTERFNAGIDFHKRMQKALSRAVMRRYGSVPLIEQEHEETFWHLVCSPDLIADFEWEDGVPEETVWEFKGYNDKEFRDELLKNKPPADAMQQCMIYMWFTGIMRGLVVVQNKNTQALLVWPVIYDEAMIERLIPNLEKVARDVKIHQQTLKLPKRLAECTAPDAPTPSGCAACVSCFSTPDELVKRRLPEAWEGVV